MLNLLEEVKKKGINIVVTAHAQISKFEQPDELGAYDRWSLKLQKKTAPLLKEWADMVLFCNYKTIVVNVDGQGVQKGKNKAQGGKRTMYTSHHNCWDAKNRHNLPFEVEMNYSSIANCIPELELNNNKKKAIQETTTTIQDKAQEEIPFSEIKGTNEIEPVIEKEPKQVIDEMPSSSAGELEEDDELKGIPNNLADLMRLNKVSISDVEEIVTKRGYFPAGTPIQSYPVDFINGCLVGAWEQVYAMIRDMKLTKGEFINAENEDMPF